MIYRPEIDVLRAFSILFVVIYHFFPESLPGGFIGVDVFFVISGYLITQIILLEHQNSTFSFIRFYQRRITRLFPALITIFLSLLIFGYFFLLSDEYLSLSQVMLSASFFYTNISLYLSSGYFDSDSNYKILLHLWSLAVEEQFYLIWPLILSAAFKSKKLRIFKFVTMALIISFALSILNTFFDSDAAYYLMPNRLWQILLGSVIALMRSKIVQTPIFIEKFKSIVFLISLVTLFVSPFLISKYDYYPGFLALLPTLSGFFLLLIEPPESLHYVFNNKILIYIGKISYPLYLWHWIILSGSLTLAQWQPSLTLNLSRIGLSFALSILTYHFVELPARRSREKFHTSAGLVVVLFGIAVTSSFIVMKKGLPNRFPELEITGLASTEFISNSKSDFWQDCTSIFFDIEMCAISNKEKPPTVLVFGDSHANHFYPGLVKHFSSLGENVLLLAKSGTAPFLNISTRRTGRPNLNDVFSFLQKTDSIHTVILSAFWSSFSEEKGVLLSFGRYKNVLQSIEGNQKGTQREVFKSGFENSLRFLMQLNKKIVLLADVPALSFNPLDCRNRPFFTSIKECKFSLEKYLNENSFFNSLLVEAQKQYPKLEVYRPANVLCNAEKTLQQCDVFYEDLLVYFDSHHLTVKGSETIVKKMLDKK